MTDFVLLRPQGERTRRAQERPAQVSQYYVQFESLGLGYLAAFLRERGARVEILDGTIDSWSPDAIVQHILALNPRILGFSILWEGYPDAQSIGERLRAAGWTGHLTMGQHFATFNHERVLQDFPELDSVVRFEGEHTSWELLQAVRAGEQELGDIKGLSWRRPDGSIAANPIRPLIEDLDTLPFPARDVMTRNPEKLDWVTLAGSRGCPWRCRYCSISTFYRIPEGSIFRHRSPKNIVDEMVEIMKVYGKNQFAFVDDQFTGGGKRGRRFAESLADEILDRGLKVRFSIENRADTIDVPIFRKLKQAGLQRVFMGIESGYQPTLDYYRKDISVEQNMKAIRTLESLDIAMSLGFMFFNPRTDAKEIRANLSFLREARQTGPEIFFQDLTIWSGTAMMDEERGGRDLSGMYTVEYELEDPEARHFRDVIRSLVKPMASPFSKIQKERARSMSETFLLRFEESMRNAAFNLAEEVLEHIERSELTDEKLSALHQRAEQEATRIQVALDVTTLLTGGSETDRTDSESQRPTS